MDIPAVSSPLVLAFYAACSLFFCTSCSDVDQAKIRIEQTEKAVRCPGQYNKLITTDYFGAHPDDYPPTDPTPRQISHAAAAELVYSEAGWPPKVRFAMAWVRKSNKNIYFRIWDTHTKSFQGAEQLLKDWPSPNGWIKTLGFDENCTVVQGASTCAWFTWEDTWGDVNRAAVGDNGGTYIGAYFDGFEPSGDTGTFFVGGWPWGYIVRRKLLAYINPDRKQVRAKILNSAGQEIQDILVYAIPTSDSSFSAFQTAVSYSTNEQRWLVAWAENDWPKDTGKNGKVMVRYVDFDGQLGPAPQPTNPVMYCATSSPECGATKQPQAIAGGGQWKYNSHCYCKSIWLASSYYSSIQDNEGVVKDRYRVHQYFKNAQINGNGERVALYEGANKIGCTDWCPMTEAAFYYPGGYTPFQVLSSTLSPVRIEHIRLKENSFVHYNAGTAIDGPAFYPQAFRSNGSITVAVGTDLVQNNPSNAKLELSIVDLYQGGCP